MDALIAQAIDPVIAQAIDPLIAQAIDPVIARIHAIDWQRGGAWDRRRSRVALMREFLRRSALWARALGCAQRWPFFDLASCFADAAAADALPELHVPQSLPTLVRATLHWMLRDAARSAIASATDLPPLPPLYEPLLRFYERGGSFRKEAGFVDVDGAGISVRDIEKLSAIAELKSFADAELDALDQVNL
jgi:hypothetical protein